VILQTQSRTGETGTCFRTCIASLLDLKESQVPDWPEANQDPGVDKWLAKRGLKYEEVPVSNHGVRPAGYYFALGLSPRGGQHAVIMKDGKLVMDPHPQDGTGRGLVKVESWGVLVPTEKTRAKDMDLRDGVTKCQACGVGLMGDDVLERGGKVICPECADSAVRRKAKDAGGYTPAECEAKIKAAIHAEDWAEAKAWKRALEVAKAWEAIQRMKAKDTAYSEAQKKYIDGPNSDGEFSAGVSGPSGAAQRAGFKSRAEAEAWITKMLPKVSKKPALDRSRAKDSQVDEDAAELARAYKTQGEQAARKLWAEKTKGLNYGQQVILQDKMARLIKQAKPALDRSRAKDAENWLDNPKRLFTELKSLYQQPHTPKISARIKELEAAVKPLVESTYAKQNPTLDRSRLHRALDAVMDSEEKPLWKQIDETEVRIRKIINEYGRSNSKLPALQKKLKMLRASKVGN